MNDSMGELLPSNEVVLALTRGNNTELIQLGDGDVEHIAGLANNYLTYRSNQKTATKDVE